MPSSPNAETETEQPGEEDRHTAEELPGEIIISYPPTPDSLNNVRFCFVLPCNITVSSNAINIHLNDSMLHVVSEF